MHFGWMLDSRHDLPSTNAAVRYSTKNDLNMMLVIIGPMSFLSYKARPALNFFSCRIASGDSKKEMLDSDWLILFLSILAIT